VPSLAPERGGEPGEIPGRRGSSPLRVAIARLDVDEQPRERHDVLGIVPGDLDER
jgi:hypothetical protein